MKVLLTGANGYIGKRLLLSLVVKGYHVICGVRDKSRFTFPNSLKGFVSVIELDLLKKQTLQNIPNDISGAYYLVHSMSTSTEYQILEAECAENFVNQIKNTKCKHVVYLSGIVNDEQLSKHLSSRMQVEQILQTGPYKFTTLRAGIIIGSGSASFEIIRDLVEKLPFMITPKWLNTKCQPIAIADVVHLLSDALFHPKIMGKSFDIGGPNILSYKEMLLGFAKARGLRRYILTLPIMTPRLSSYWLFFVTSTSYKLAVALVNSMKVEVICKNNDIKNIIPINNYSYQTALQRALVKIEKGETPSSWKDSFSSGGLNINISDFIEVPQYGCFKDYRARPISNKIKTIDKLWRIGGDNGWYAANWLWKIRGILDKVFGGVGLRRGRTNPDIIKVGDTIDFWRVLYASKEEGRLLLLAEMKLPGEAWLEFKISNDVLNQKATFRPKGLLGRMYWWSVYPFHGVVFNRMLKKLAD